MSLPNNGNGFGANNASLRAFRQVNTNNSSDDFQQAASHNGASLLQTISIDIPVGTATGTVIPFFMPKNFFILANSLSGVNTSGSTVTATLSAGVGSSVLTALTGAVSANPDSVAAVAVAGLQTVTVTGPALTTSALAVNITGIQA